MSRELFGRREVEERSLVREGKSFSCVAVHIVARLPCSLLLRRDTFSRQSVQRWYLLPSYVHWAVCFLDVEVTMYQ
jgi:hypothetical protein